MKRIALRAQNKEVCNEDMNWGFIFVRDHHFSYQHGRDRLRRKWERRSPRNKQRKITICNVCIEKDNHSFIKERITREVWDNWRFLWFRSKWKEGLKKQLNNIQWLWNNYMEIEMFIKFSDVKVIGNIMKRVIILFE